MPSSATEIPLVTVAIVCLNEIGNIGRCLQSLLDLDYDGQKYEILVIDNGSTDGTQDVLREFEGKTSSPKLRWLVNPVKGIAGSRNMAMKEAAHGLVAFTDADCLVPEQWLSGMVKGFTQIIKSDDRLVAVGGANFPPKNCSDFYDALSCTLQTYLGNRGSTQGKVFDEITRVPHMPTVNILYRRELVLAEGGFDEKFSRVCEDPELHHRLVKKGYHIYFLPGCHVWHYMRNSLSKYTENIFIYGKGRISLLKKHPDHFSFVYLVPPLLVLSIFIGNLMGALIPCLFWVNVYFAVLLVYSLYVGIRSGKCRLAGKIFLIYLATHFAYGLGELKELGSPQLK